MKNYFVFKETSNGAHIVIDEIIKFIDKEFANYSEIATLAVEYNGSKDAQRRAAIIDEVKKLLDVAILCSFKEFEDFEIDHLGQLYFKGLAEPIPTRLAEYMKMALEEGIELTPYINFWKNLILNPDKSVRAQLFGFLENNGHPITTNGYFLAYKAVNVKKKYDKETGKELVVKEYDEETGKLKAQPINQALVFTSIHSGPFGGTIKVGEPVKMPREECDNNPHQTCSKGLHVGSMAYVKDFGHSDSVVLEVLVNPRHVVSVPVDYNNTKMRVCEYYPFAISNGENESVYLETDYIGYDKKQMEAEIKTYEEAKKKAIEALEKELEMKKLAAGLL